MHLHEISVIVPVYNVEKYLWQCVTSILSQSYSSIEVLLINDGSTDDSYSICKNVAESDARVRIISQSNRGLGPTRNVGIREAKGEYLAFVDSDDFLAEDSLEKLYKRAIETGADIVEGQTLLYTDSTKQSRLRLSLENEIVQMKDNDTAFLKTCYFNRKYSHNAWDKLYKASFVKSNGLEFGDNRRIFAEDNWFHLQAFKYKPLIAYCNCDYYYYRQQENSIMHKPKKNLCGRHGNMIGDYYQYIDIHGASDADYQMISLVAFDIFYMEAVNAKLTGIGKEQLTEIISGIRQNEILDRAIRSIQKYRSYLLVDNRVKRMYIRLITDLYIHDRFNAIAKVLNTRI